MRSEGGIPDPTLLTHRLTAVELIAIDGPPVVDAPFLRLGGFHHAIEVRLGLEW